MAIRRPDRSLFDVATTRASRQVYLGIDGTNWLHTIYHANNGHDVLETVVRRIDALTRNLQPKLVVVCLDRRSFRHDLYPPYKAKRGERPHDENLHFVLENALGVLKDWAVVVQVNGFEADDCLAALAARAVAVGSDAVLASPDKDLNQCLVADRVTIIKKFHLLGSGITNIEWMTPQLLLDQKGLTPRQWIDYQTLAGDSGDGVPGCPGWGEKTASEAIRQWGSIDAIYDNIDSVKVSASRRAALLKFRDDGLAIMRQLVTLRTDVDEVKRIFVSRRRIGASHART